MILSVIIAFFSVIGLLALHEFGHFLVAKKFGIRVDEFGIGYPPRLFGKKIGDTLYSLNLLPFGAFVRIPSLDEGETSIEESLAFEKKPIWQRAWVLLGGVVSFWLVAFLLLSFVFFLGAPQAISDDQAGVLNNPRVEVLSVSNHSPAQEAGIKSGDMIKEMSFSSESVMVEKVGQVQSFTDKYKGQMISLKIQRGKEILNVSLVPRVSPPAGEGVMGVSLVRVSDVSYAWWQSPIKVAEATFNMTYRVVAGWAGLLKNLISGQGMPQGVELVGPVGIGAMVSQAFQVGITYFLQFIAMIAIYLAVFNILPIPSLDGGKLLFLLIEKIKGQPVNTKTEQKITLAFFGVMVLLAIWVTFKDISKLF